jgi:hypothetical protein
LLILGYYPYAINIVYFFPVHRMRLKLTAMVGWGLSMTVGSRDAAVERTGTYLPRVMERFHPTSALHHPDAHY